MIHYTIVDGEDLERIRAHAKNCWLNGISRVRSSKRAEHGPEDQLIGQLGEFAFSKWMGDADSYFARRERMDLNPTEGDGGSDFDGTSIDVKASKMRVDRHPMSFNLLVRPIERRDDSKYVLALIKELEDSFRVTLVGWAHDKDLPAKPVSKGVFEGAYKLPASRLKPMTELRNVDAL